MALTLPDEIARWREEHRSHHTIHEKLEASLELTGQPTD
jgi:hypothetical protein